jgi:hypothetical protein
MIEQCYVKDDSGKQCEQQAMTHCERCHKPICEDHREYVDAFFTYKRYDFCLNCKIQYSEEREY